MTALGERLVFIDIEAAGAEPWRPIMQIAAMATGSRTQELETFERKIRFNPWRAAPRRLLKKQYDPKVWIRKGVAAKTAAADFAEFLRRHATVDVQSASGQVFQVAQLVAHNSQFDGPFIQKWFERQGVYLPASYRVLCTMQRAMWFFSERKDLTPPDDYKLVTLCQYFGVPLSSETAHDAMVDVVATFRLCAAIEACYRADALPLTPCLNPIPPNTTNTASNEPNCRFLSASETSVPLSSCSRHPKAS